MVLNIEHNVIFNVLAKDIENAKELAAVGGDRVLIGVMVKNLTDEEAIMKINELKENNIRTSIGLGAADPNMWERVANIAAITAPDHINQIFPAAGYTLGRMIQSGVENSFVNAVIIPSGIPGKVYITTGPKSSKMKEAVSCEVAATLLAEIGCSSVKFYPINGNKHLEEVAEMVKASTKAGLTVFEPTGGIDLENCEEIVRVCLESGAKVVIPHLYTSLIDNETGKTNPEKIRKLINIKF